MNFLLASRMNSLSLMVKQFWPINLLRCVAFIPTSFLTDTNFRKGSSKCCEKSSLKIGFAKWHFSRVGVVMIGLSSRLSTLNMSDSLFNSMVRYGSAILWLIVIIFVCLFVYLGCNYIWAILILFILNLQLSASTGISVSFFI